jgi:hypothetical protein
MPMEILATGASGPAGGAWSVFSQVQVRRRHTKIETRQEPDDTRLQPKSQ